MATRNSVNNSSIELTIDPNAATDSYIQHSINGTGEFRTGVDDNDSDKYKISQGSALGTNDFVLIEDSGEITKPLQPAVNAYLNATVNNVTGDGTEWTILWNAVFFDQGSNFNTGTGTFLAPVDGKYRVSLNCWLGAVSNVAYTSQFVRIVTSNRTYHGAVGNAYIFAVQAGAAGQGTSPLSALVDMDAADTLTTTVMVSGGAKTILAATVGTATPRGWLSISLVC